MRVLVVNTGSSSLKLSVLDDERTVDAQTVERWDGAGDLDPLRDFLSDAGFSEGAGLDAIGHRVVHGGPRFRAPVHLDDEAVDYLDSISDLAPLHNPRAVSAIRAMGELLPDLPAVGAFDTAFHATIPEAAATYALPREWNHRFGLRRYGFHGLSHAHAVRRGAELVGRPAGELRIVSCHLGAGASLCAVRDGRSVDTTMGFTPLAGLVMQTRVGSVDPGILLWLLEHGGVDVETLGGVLEHQSGLKGLSGTSGDLRDVLAARAAGDTDAVLAFDVYVHRLVREIGSMVASAGGLDLLVFTGGMGEHSPEVRAATTDGLFHLGVEIDPEVAVDGDTVVTRDGARVHTVVVAAAEDLEVARETADVLGATGSEGR
ncbi:MAG: acetate/propionate family kinase [Nocardioides sp.]